MHDFVMIAAVAGDRLVADPPFRPCWPFRPFWTPPVRAGVFFYD